MNSFPIYAGIWANLILSMKSQMLWEYVHSNAVMFSKYCFTENVSCLMALSAGGEVLYVDAPFIAEHSTVSYTLHIYQLY